MALGNDRQGHPSSGWQNVEISQFNLPTLINMGKQTAYQREDHARIDSELLWPLETGRLIIKAFLPNSYAAAMRALQVIVKHGTPAASREIKALINPVGIGKPTPSFLSKVSQTLMCLSI
jgi:hypothetical protein